MASFEKRSGGWRASVAIKGNRDTKTFTTKAEAIAWAADTEAKFRKQVTTGIVSDKTLGDAFERYKEEVTPKKDSDPKWELNRLDKIGRDKINKILLREVLLSEVTPDLWGKWRDMRLNEDEVSGSTVNREFKLLSNVFTIAMREWKWIAANPIKDVRRPKENKHRTKLYSDDEIDRLMLVLGFNERKVTKKKQCVAVAFLFAIETGMRLGEICRLTQASINGRVAHLDKTKNGMDRDVPLSKRAIELLTFLPDVEDGMVLFTIGASSASTTFRNDGWQKIGLDDVTFHDTRHLAITRLSKKLDVLALAKMVGHKNINELMTYYNLAAEDIADRL